MLLKAITEVKESQYCPYTDDDERGINHEKV